MNGAVLLFVGVVGGAQVDNFALGEYREEMQKGRQSPSSAGADS